MQCPKVCSRLASRANHQAHDARGSDFRSFSGDRDQQLINASGDSRTFSNETDADDSVAVLLKSDQRGWVLGLEVDNFLDFKFELFSGPGV